MGGGGSNQKKLIGRGMDIFWNNTINFAGTVRARLLMPNNTLYNDLSM